MVLNPGDLLAIQQTMQVFLTTPATLRRAGRSPDLTTTTYYYQDTVLVSTYGMDALAQVPRTIFQFATGTLIAPGDRIILSTGTWVVGQVFEPQTSELDVWTTVYAVEMAGASGLPPFPEPQQFATILQYGSMIDPDNGAPILGYTPFSPTYPCSIERDIRPNETDNAGRLTTTTYWLIRMPMAARGHVTSKDRIAVGPRTFEVLSPVDGSYDVVLPILCVEVL